MTVKRLKELLNAQPDTYEVLIHTADVVGKPINISNPRFVYLENSEEICFLACTLTKKYD